VSTAGPVQLDLAATASELAAAAGHGPLQPLGLGQVIDGDGALGGLTAAVAALAGDGVRVTVLAAATPMTVGGRDLREVVSGLSWMRRRRAAGRSRTLGSVRSSTVTARWTGCLPR